MRQASFFERSSYERFRKFHDANPHVYVHLVRMARQAQAAGASKLGVRMLWEVLRWKVLIRTVRVEGDFKLNDHYPPHFARMIMAQEPDLADIFETRELRSA